MYKIRDRSLDNMIKYLNSMVVLFLNILRPLTSIIIICSQFTFSSDNSKSLDDDITQGFKDNISSVANGLIDQNKISFLNYDQIPDLRQMDRDPSSLIDRWTIRRAYGSEYYDCLLYTSPSPRDLSTSRMPSSA